MKNAELWLSHEEIRNLSKKPEPNVHVEQFQKSQHWARLLQEGMVSKFFPSNPKRTLTEKNPKIF